MTNSIGWAGLDVPLELIEAAGHVPLWLRGDAAHPGPAADGYAEGGGHPQVHALAAAVLAQGAAGLGGIVIGAAPVANQTLFHFLHSLPPEVRLPRLHLLQILHRAEAWCAIQNLDEMRALGTALGVDAAALPAAIKARNNLRLMLQQLEARRRSDRPSISGSEMLGLYAQAGTGPASSLMPGLQSRLDRPAAPLPPQPRLLLCGSAVATRELYAAFEAGGCHIVAEDHDEGERSAGPMVAEAGDPYQALAGAYAARAPAAADWTTAQACQALLDRVCSSRADAVVFHIPGFEHPDAWDFPARRAMLEQSHIPFFLLPAASFRAPAAAVAALLPDLDFKR